MSENVAQYCRADHTGQRRRRTFLGWLRHPMALPTLVLLGLAMGTQAIGGVTPDESSVARVWNEELLEAIRIDRPKPPVHARNLFHLSVAMWDAWAAYDPVAVGYLIQEKHDANDIEAARREAISYAAYRLLRHRFPGGGIDVDDQPCQPGAETSLAAFDARMDEFGYDRAFTSAEGDSPAALGNRIAATVIAYGLNDGANEGRDLCYPDDTGYQPINDELIFKLPGAVVVDPNHWQPLAFDFLILQNGIVIGEAIQEFVGVGWADVLSFALTESELGAAAAADCTVAPSAGVTYLDPGCAPQLGGVGDDIVRDSVLELIRMNSWVDPRDEERIDISPGVWGNNTLGADDRRGHPINPVTRAPYPSNLVKRADYARVVAEFWADGPNSETPPGHWNVLANEVTDHRGLGAKLLAGAGEPLDDLEWDVKLYLTLNGALHDAAIAAWSAKHYYDSSRPITLIRHIGGLGQSSDPDGPSYDPNGLPLVPGEIELITVETAAPGGRHEALSDYVGEVAVLAWLGTPENHETEFGGVDWIRVAEWLPYQESSFVSPPFPGYTSGHSTFSRAAAEVLAMFTGSEYFPGGLGKFVAQQNEYLRFELGPSETVELQWATYFDAADEAGISRRYGGIHPYYDDYPGRIAAKIIGRKAMARALSLFGITEVDVCYSPPRLRIREQTTPVSPTVLEYYLQLGATFGACERGQTMHYHIATPSTSN